MSGPERAAVAGAAAIDAVVYATVVTGIASVASTLTAFAAGGDWSTVKALLFVLGAVLLGYATAQLWVSTRNGNGDRDGEGWTGARSEAAAPTRLTSRFRSGSRAVSGRTETRFQRFVERIPPRRWVEVAPRASLSPTAKIFLAGVMVMVVSFCMEAVFGV